MGPLHHFFGYYGIDAWDPSGRFHLALETDFHRRPPSPADTAAVGLVDRETGEFSKVSATRAFNLQQGSMLQWIDTGRGPELTHNDWDGGRTVSRAIALGDRSSRIIGRAIAAVSTDGTAAMGLSYERMYRCRRVVGYANDADPASLAPAPDDDGLYRIDLESGAAELVLSIARVVRTAGVHERVAGPFPSGHAWFNHVMFNTDGSRVLFFCRIGRPGAVFRSSLWTVNPDGSDLRLQIGFGHWISHFAWQDTDTLLVSTDLRGRCQFLVGHDGRDDFEPVGEGVLPDDGHACYSPDGRWIACDTYPHGPEHHSEVMLYEVTGNRKVSLGFYRSEEIFRGEIRCDLHPRWTPDGRGLTIDAVRDGDRQIYLIDVADVVS